MLRRGRFTIDDDADALAVGEELFFDSCEVFPTHFDHLSVLAALHHCPWFQSDGERDGGHDAQVDDEAEDEQHGSNSAADGRCSLVHRDT